MIAIQTGEIRLCHSNFVLHSHTSPQEVETCMANAIVRQDDSGTGYRHYMLWLDIDPHEYVYAVLAFFHECLQYVEILPQNHTDSAEERKLSCMELAVAREKVLDWYKTRFSEAKMRFPWGEVSCYEGSDPIYSPPKILIQYF